MWLVKPILLLTSVKNLFLHDFETRRIKTETHSPSDHALIAGDQQALTQILVNILSNAVKFSKDGGKIQASWAIRADGKGVFQIKDEGCGIEKKRLDKLSEPFPQGKAHVTLQGPGTGLGLYISRRLIEFHGGSLVIHSELGEGTEVTVILPAERIMTSAHHKVIAARSENESAPELAPELGQRIAI